jgi:hypothetical protein
MQKGLSTITKDEILIYLKKSETFFYSSNEIIENRIDSKFYRITVSILIDSMNSLSGKTSQIDHHFPV